MVLAEVTLVHACGRPGDRNWLCEAAFRSTGSETIARAADLAAPWVNALLILLGAWAAHRVVRRLIHRAVLRIQAAESRRRAPRPDDATAPDVAAARREQRAATVAAGLGSLATIVIAVVAVIAVLGAFGIALGPLVAGAGLIGVALGFGAQNLLRDLIAGAFMIGEDQFGVGDVIDAGAATGTVEEVSLRSTRLRDLEGVVWHIPNGEIRRVGNKSQQWSRAVIDVPFGPDVDIDRATETIRMVGERLHAEPAWAAAMLGAPEVLGVESMGMEGITIRVVAKTQPAQQWRVARELRARLKAALDAAGVPVRSMLLPPPTG